MASPSTGRESVRNTILAASLLLGALSQAQVHVALIRDADPNTPDTEIQQRFIDELLALTAGEFDVRITRFAGNWSREGIERRVHGSL